MKIEQNASASISEAKNMFVEEVYNFLSKMKRNASSLTFFERAAIEPLFGYQDKGRLMTIVDGLYKEVGFKDTDIINVTVSLQRTLSRITAVDVLCESTVGGTVQLHWRETHKFAGNYEIRVCHPNKIVGVISGTYNAKPECDLEK